MNVRLARWSFTFWARGAGGALRGGGGAVLLLARPTHDSVNNVQGEKHVFSKMGAMLIFFYEFHQH